jgi:tetratricopeptide (TPR) repeat protein
VRIGEFFQGMRKPLLAAAVLGILIAAGTFWQLGRRMDYSRLATFPREETTSSLVRGPRLSDTVRELMETGAGYFETERYAEADRYFRAVLDRDSTVAQAAYFLGLCRIFSGDAASAVPHLERASRMAGDELRSGALWVLANAYLKAKSLAKARGVLEDLATGRNEYAVKAQHLLGRLPR